MIEGDIQGAITYFETAFTQSQSAEYIGGLFCASKHLGDIYYNTVRKWIENVKNRIVTSMLFVGMNMLINW